MLTDNNQIFRKCFVIIHYHLTKVSARINKCLIFEPNGLSRTLCTLWLDIEVAYIVGQFACAFNE